MNDLKRTARITGLWYIGLALTGVLGFLLVRPAIHVPGNAAATAQNLVENEALARLGVALELGIVLTQAFLAVWFYKLFRSLNSIAAGSLAAFGLINAIMILGALDLRRLRWRWRATPTSLRAAMSRPRSSCCMR